jgi:microcystin-dependent protein
VHFGGGILQAETLGVETVTLTTAQMPAHTHPQTAIDNTATEITPIGNVFARTQGDVYSSRPPDTTLAAATVGNVGGSQPHDNMQPFLCVSFIISLFGIFPSPT